MTIYCHIESKIYLARQGLGKTVRQISHTTDTPLQAGMVGVEPGSTRHSVMARHPIMESSIIGIAPRPVSEIIPQS